MTFSDRDIFLIRQTFTKALSFCHCLGLWGCLQGKAAQRRRSGHLHPSDAFFVVDVASPPHPSLKDPRPPQVWHDSIQNHPLLLYLSFSSSFFCDLPDCRPVSLWAGNCHTCNIPRVNFRVSIQRIFFWEFERLIRLKVINHPTSIGPCTWGRSFITVFFKLGTKFLHSRPLEKVSTCNCILSTCTSWYHRQRSDGRPRGTSLKIIVNSKLLSTLH